VLPDALISHSSFLTGLPDSACRFFTVWPGAYACCTKAAVAAVIEIFSFVQILIKQIQQQKRL